MLRMHRNMEDDEIEKMAEENNSSTSGYATDSSGGFIATEES